MNEKIIVEQQQQRRRRQQEVHSIEMAFAMRLCLSQVPENVWIVQLYRLETLPKKAAENGMQV